jgi:hypothetical protein
MVLFAIVGDVAYRKISDAYNGCWKDCNTNALRLERVLFNIESPEKLVHPQHEAIQQLPIIQDAILLS